MSDGAPDLPLGAPVILATRVDEHRPGCHLLGALVRSERVDDPPGGRHHVGDGPGHGMDAT